MITVATLETFLADDYSDRDLMHGIQHIRRLHHGAVELGTAYPHNPDTLCIGAYFHGVIYSREEDLKRFLESHGYDARSSNAVLTVARESQISSSPTTIEGKLLHDAHLLEGGKAFFVTKSLVTGALRGFTVEESVAFIEQNVLGKVSCILPESERPLREKMRYASEFVNEFKKGMSIGKSANK